MDVDHFDEKERYPHRIITPRLIEALCFSQLPSSVDDPAWFSLDTVSKMPVVAAECDSSHLGRTAPPNIEILSFLKRGPRTEEDDDPWA